MKKLLLLFVAVMAMSLSAAAQQSQRVTGIVFSEDTGEPLVGATVVGTGTTIGTVTNVDGVFDLLVPETLKKITVSYVGMKTQEFTITPGQQMSVTLQNDNSLDEVIVTALGITRDQKSLGFSATQVSDVEIQRAQSANVMSALQGKVAGLTVQSTSGDPGSANNVNIRGLGSINGSNQPLYVVDGVPVANYTFNSQGHAVATGGINNIAPDDIASVTVLKGAAATSLYGSRASNGVILITTKSGSGEGNKNYSITYNGNVEFNRVSMLPEMQNKWGQGWNGNQTFIENGSWGPALDGSQQVYGPQWNYSQLIHKYDAKENNVKDFFDTGVSQKHNIALSGISNNKEMTYYLSYGYTGINGMMPGDGDTHKRNTISFRGTYEPEKWLKVSSSMNFATYKTKTVGTYQGTSVIDGLYETPRDVSLVDMKNLNSAFNTPEAYYTPYGITNPYWALANNYYETIGKQVFGKLQLDIKPIDALTLTYRFGFDYSDYDNKIGYPQIALDDALIQEDYGYAPSNMNQAGWVYARYNRAFELNHDFMASYNKKFLDNRLDVNVTAGVNINERHRTAMYGQTDDLNFYTGFWQLGNGSTRTSLAESQTKRRMVGLYGYASFGWDDFVYMDITGRNDWSSTLPKDNRSFFYPGVTLSGIFSRFIENKSILSFGKVRLAYGKTGNDADEYMTDPTFLQAYTNGYYGNYIIKFPFNSVNSYMYSSTMGSQSLRPEMTKEFEVGLNLRFFNNRIDIDATYYNRITEDQIFTLPVDPSTGFSSQVINFGKVRNRGVELMINTTPIETRNFRWDLGFNWTLNRNKVLSMPESLEGGKVDIYDFSAGDDAVYMYAEEGMPLGTYYTYLPQYVTDESSPYYGCPIVDSAGQPVLSDNIEYTGYDMNHKWTGGLTTSFSAYGFTLSAAFDFRVGGKMFSRTKNLMQFTGNGKVTEYNERRPFIIPNSVVANGDGTYSENTTPIYVADGSYQDYFNNYGWGNGGMAYLINRSYTKLRNLSLSWDVPRKWVNKAFLQDVTLTAYCNNVFTWTAKDNRYVDPETTTVTSYGDLAYGFGELYSNPSSRTFGINLKVNF